MAGTLLFALKGCVKMSRLIIEGGHPLRGEVSIQGAKNSALPVLAATVLCSSQCIIHNCPFLSDVDTSMKILRHLGCTVSFENGSMTIDTSGLNRHDIPNELMREMRSSIVFLGSISAREGKAKISSPGGCELGPRPIDLHLSSLRQLGLTIHEDRGWLDCSVKDGLRGATIALSFPSVGATENIMLAASLARGGTTIINAAREPEITDLAGFLNKCGAKIYGAGESVVRVEGVKSLHGCEYTVIPDRIVAATYMAAAGITGGDVTLDHVIASHLTPVIPMMEEAGCTVSVSPGRVGIKRTGTLHALKTVRTMPFPGFPTDAQAPLMAMVSIADGTSVFIETIFQNRYKHTEELARMGAQIKVEGKVAIVEGVPGLFGTVVEATDLRGGAALVVAGLAAEGVTEVHGMKHIDRGYEDIASNLQSLGAKIRRE